MFTWWKPHYNLYCAAFTFVTAFLSPNEFGFAIGIVLTVLNVAYWAVASE